MIYLDANFFIFALLDQTRKGEKARALLKDIITGKNAAVTSALALDEVLWVLRRNDKKHLMRRTIEDIYATPNLEVREVGALIPLQALSLLEEFSLKPRDAFHVAVMEQLRVTIIASDDADFDKIKRLKRLKFDT